ncbi:MAG: DUF1573 domain-containing protein [Bacteroidales bacterium]
MKKLFLFFAVLNIGVASCAQDNNQGVNATKDENAAEMIFNETDHNFGVIQHKGNGTFEFVFKNTGKEPLIIKNVTTSCGCTVPSWDKDPIAPKKTGKIVVKYDTERIGPFIKSIKVFSNAKNSPVEIMIRGEVKVSD